MHKLFGILRYKLITLSRPVNQTKWKSMKKTIYWIVDLAVLADQREKLKESENKDEYLNLARELKETMEHESDSDINFNWCTWNNPQRIDKGSEILGNKRTSKNYLNYRLIKIC